MEFTSQEIPPQSTIQGWLYFKFTDENGNAKDFFSSLTNYQLEIAHIKNTATNEVFNVYIPLNSLLKLLT